MKQITLQITTRNRLEDLKISLRLNLPILLNENVHTIICVDGSRDDTFNFIKKNYPEIELIKNEKSIGLIASRNKMMSLTKTPFAISLDDDAHFLGKDNVELILKYFSSYKTCAVIAFRIYWGQEELDYINDKNLPCRVRGFVGCGHAWRMKHWKQIRPYPSWFVFYGEEEFASYELFKHNLEVHYVPNIFIQHRVDIKSRKKSSDYFTRNRRSLRAGWYLWLMFIPYHSILKNWSYSVYSQFRLKVLKGQPLIFFTIFLAFLDVILNIPRILADKNRLSKVEYMNYLKLPQTKIFWKQ